MANSKLSKKAKKDLNKLTNNDAIRILKALRYLETNPYFGKKMKGEFKGLWRIKIPPFRVIYRYDKSTNLILIVSIGYREGIYKRLGL